MIAPGRRSCRHNSCNRAAVTAMGVDPTSKTPAAEEGEEEEEDEVATTATTAERRL